jgi:hypothetical protein
MPRKPTQPFGHIAFSKEGKVTKNTTLLPDDKEGQEVGVVARFVEYLHQHGKHFEPEKLPEHDNDFLLKTAEEGTDVLLELVELVGREYLVEATDEYLNNPNPRFQHWVYLAPDKIYGVDEKKKNISIKRLIEHKIDKSYAKPKDEEFWLLIWTVQSDHPFEWWQAGVNHVSLSVMAAREYLKDNGAGPFDQIWAYFPEVSPCKIWPIEHR